MAAALFRYAPIADALACLGHPFLEVVIHDLAAGRIAHIAGGFSKRRVGSASLTELEGIGSLDADVLGPYPKTNWDGRALKSITAVLRDDCGQPIGLMCANLDVSASASLAQSILAFLPPNDRKKRPSALFTADWREDIHAMIGDFCANRQTMPERLAPEDREPLIAALDARGIFRVRNAASHVAGILQISRATLYKSLKRQRELLVSAATETAPTGSGTTLSAN